MCCDLDLEHSNSKVLHNTPAHDDAPPHQLWLQKVQKFRIWRKLNLDYLTLHCDLDLEDRNPTFLHDTPCHVMHHHTKSGCIQFSGSEDLDKGVTDDLMAHTEMDKLILITPHPPSCDFKRVTITAMKT